ncbi:hypothetical protein C8N32_10363 [Rhodovulum imhoffii]|uniref:Lipoprotein n=1 Tax=Rhodovulum imhoffii TaxID=365340 RepID=A0A2T5BUL3_9RHOB|nr:hypothetical protein [Rhodovulum imhoffii]MBK5934819.1 hypothetical protein [Rhodovulum imhoffii]PTN03221.1 hypothetical protein C8N32_10363 [Rhodovulum imhoffii]
MRAFVLIAVLGLAACAQPSGHVGVAPDGKASGAVRSGPASAGVGPNGANASVKVVDTPTTDVTVGTGGAGVSVRPAGSPVGVGIGPGGLRVGF